MGDRLPSYSERSASIGRIRRPRRAGPQAANVPSNITIVATEKSAMGFADLAYT